MSYNDGTLLNGNGKRAVLLLVAYKSFVNVRTPPVFVNMVPLIIDSIKNMPNMSHQETS